MLFASHPGVQNTFPTPTVDPRYADGRLTDIHLTLGRRRLDLLGPDGPQAEVKPVRDFLDSKPESGTLPVVLGAGFGHGLEKLLEARKGPVAVVDAESKVGQLTGVRKKFQDVDDITWFDAPAAPEELLERLVDWGQARDGTSLAPIAHPAYLRLRPELYGHVLRGLKGGFVPKDKPAKASDFWAKARHRKFTSWPPRVLCITTDYFLMGEVEAALNRLGVPHKHLALRNKELGCTEFVEELLTSVVQFKPDFVLTINHMGVDREGVLTDLLARLELPLASWFVDNPHLVLDMYNKVVSPHVAVFSWDRDNLPTLRAMGFEHVDYLSLGADVHRFRLPKRPLPAGHPYRARVSFVGNSMLGKIGHRLRASKPPRELLRTYRQVAMEFSQSTERSVQHFLKRHHPELWPAHQSLKDPARTLAFDTVLTWESTRRYRLECVEQLMEFSPLIAGDKYWKVALKQYGKAWRYHPELSYYSHLPKFYPASEVNLNATNMQMKGAVNQRVFDVPACGGFVLSDFREQLAELFELGTEAVCYQEPGEIPDLVRYYLDNPEARQKIAAAGRARVLRDHTYEQRMTWLLERMASIFGNGKACKPAA